MELLIGTFVFGVLSGVVVRNRTGAAGIGLLGALLAWYIAPRLGDFVGKTATGRRIAEAIEHAGAGHVSIWLLCAAAFTGVLVAWAFFGGGGGHRPDWEWDPDHPKYRKRMRRRRALG